jgi:hypothetical protein
LLPRRLLIRLNLTGSLPPAWPQPGGLPQLQWLELSVNALGGTLHPLLTASLSRLEALRLGHNRFSGSLPPGWASNAVSTM